MCRKLETEEEKVLPFYASSLTKDEQEDVDAAVLEPPSEPLANVSNCRCCAAMLLCFISCIIFKHYG